MADFGDGHLHKVFVLKADHPWYKVRMENGCDKEISVSSLGRAALFDNRDPKLAPPRRDEFVGDEEAAALVMGSFGLRIDALRRSLRRVEEEKEHAKAVKADDAKVPVHLWNQRIEGILEEQRDRALDLFRRMGWKYFVRALRRDCARFMTEKHGRDWASKPRRSGDQLNELGHDQQAVCDQNLSMVTES